MKNRISKYLFLVLCLTTTTETTFSCAPSRTDIVSIVQTYPKSAIALVATAATLGAIKLFNKPLELESKIEHLTDQQMLDYFYVVTYAPTTVKTSNRFSLTDICETIERGDKHLLHDQHADITEKIFDEPTQAWVYKPGATEKIAHIIGGIPSGVTGTIVIYVAGFSGQHSHAPKLYPVNSVHTVHKMYEKGIIDNVYTISYSGPHQDRKTFNYGQELDQICLNRVYELTVQQNPDAKIVLFGISAGATIILNYLARQNYGAVTNAGRFAQVKAVILESPAISFDEVIESLKYSDYIWGQFPRGCKWLLPVLYHNWFVNFKPGKSSDEILTTYKHIPTHINIFLGSLEHDQVADRNATARIYFELNRDGRRVTSYEYLGKEAQHGRLGGHTKYQDAVKQFLLANGLDHIV